MTFVILTSADVSGHFLARSSGLVFMSKNGRKRRNSACVCVSLCLDISSANFEFINWSLVNHGVLNQQQVRITHNDGVMSSLLLVVEAESEKAVSNVIDVGFSMRDSQGGVATMDVLVVVTVLVGREEKRKSELGFGS